MGSEWQPQGGKVKGLGGGGGTVFQTDKHVLSIIYASINDHINAQRGGDFKKTFPFMAITKMADGYFACFIFKPNFTSEID